MKSSTVESKVGWQNEPDPTMAYLNPFTAARNNGGKKQTEVAKELGVDITDIIRLEQAIYTTVPDNFVEYYELVLQLPEAWQAGYRKFQAMMRASAPRPIYGVWQMPRGELNFQRWRLHNWPTLSQIGWCKAFCVHPAALYAIEKGGRGVVSTEILNALVEAHIMSEEQAKNFAWRIRQAAQRTAN